MQITATPRRRRQAPGGPSTPRSGFVAAGWPRSRRIATIRAELDATPEGFISPHEQAARINRALELGPRAELVPLSAVGHRAAGADLPIRLEPDERRLLCLIGEESAADICDLYRPEGGAVVIRELEKLARNASLFATMLRASAEGVLPVAALPDVLTVAALFIEGAPPWQANAIASLAAAAPEVGA